MNMNEVKSLPKTFTTDHLFRMAQKRGDILQEANEGLSRALGEVLDRKTTLQMVSEFHKAFGVPEAGNVNDTATNNLRLSLLDEEVAELAEALSEGDPVATLDALTDIQYVLDGAFLCLGLAHFKASAFAEVHRSNMSKLGADGKPIRRADGKVLKGPNYSPPDIDGIVNANHGGLG